ncbi:MBL fold metallo-hydrolase [Thermodesulfovibrionales bacterium]|nr:MBL fold metallo-hydrolase [Thermodesulfovibrionales bacterium]MCL0107368.1 MBL fold metallo-hydrolase [Thermodesulfovibrionales bacterium]
MNYYNGGDILIIGITVGPLQVNCLIIASDESKKAIVIDPGDETERIMGAINENSLIVEHIICTHGHFDHVGVVGDLKKETGAKVTIHKDEIEIYASAKKMASLFGYDLDPLPEPDILVKDGDVVSVGTLNFEVFHTPGHTPGGICLYFSSLGKSDGTVITGDTLFAGAVGRTDLYGGDMNKLSESFKRLMVLPDNTKVLPGHGPATTIGREKRENMFSGQYL